MRELVAALAARDDGHAYRLYAGAPWDGPADAKLEWRPERARGLRWHRAVARDASRACDVFLANSYLTTPLLRIPVVTFVHDLIAFEHRLKAPARSVLVERTRLAAAVGAARRVLVPSAATKTALVQRLPAAAGKTTVMPLGVARALGPAGDSRGVRGRSILTVGLAPRRNIETLVAAFRTLPVDLRATHRLVAVGPMSRRTRGAVSAVRSLGADGALLGAVDDAALATLYRRCSVFCFPSLAEGFGLPVLEAMAAGAAVLASDHASLREVGGDAVAYARPDDPLVWSAALGALLRSDERRQSLGRAAKARADQFTWAAAAEIALDALERAAELAQPVWTPSGPAEVADQGSK